MRDKDIDALMNVPLEDLDNTVVLDGKLGSASDLRQKRDAKALGYVKIPGVVNLSYSRRSVKHTCPRKFYLREVANVDTAYSSTIHTAFGSAFGAGVQEVLRTGSLPRGIAAAFAAWDISIHEEHKYSNKNIWTALMGVEYFYEYIYPDLLDAGWELARFPDGKVGIELHYLIWFSDGYNDQGHIDVVLYNKHTNKLCVLEIKTASREQHPANWQNSEQTLGYSVVLDSFAKQLGADTTFEVEYLIYNPARKLANEENAWGFTNYTFVKSPMLKQEYLLNTLVEIKEIELMFEYKTFPKYGNACNNFNRVCDYFGRCDELFNKYIALDLEQVHRDNFSEEIYENVDTKMLDFVSDFDTLLIDQETKAESYDQADVALTPAVKGVLE